MQAAFRFFWIVLGMGLECTGVRDQALVRVFWAEGQRVRIRVYCVFAEQDMAILHLNLREALMDDLPNIALFLDLGF